MSKPEILTVDTADVRCEATVELLSRVQRPWLFRVTVMGKPPHIRTRIYDIAARSDTIAAMQGIEKFTREIKAPIQIVAPKDWR